MLRFEIALTAPFVANSRPSQIAPSRTSSKLSSGLYSSHSPGRLRVAAAGSTTRTSTSHSAARRACAPRGADHHAISIDTPINTVVSTIDCHRKIVSPNGITPVIFSSAGGRLAAFACSCAADEERPIAHDAPRPR